MRNKWIVTIPLLFAANLEANQSKSQQDLGFSPVVEKVEVKLPPILGEAFLKSLGMDVINIPNGTPLNVSESVYNRISSGFAEVRDHPVLGVSRPHKGIDIAGNVGQKILATALGHVEKVGYDEGYGHYIYIDHGNGIQTRYAHLNKPTHLKRGDAVILGEHIGNLGSTGTATGPHLHYEVRINGEAVDPIYLYTDNPDTIISNESLLSIFINQKENGTVIYNSRNT